MIESPFGDGRVLLAPHVGGAIAAFYDLPDSARSATPLHWLRPASADALASCNPLGMASFPLLPYCNRLRDARFVFDGHKVDLSHDGNSFDHALHGHAWRRPWRVGLMSSNTAELHLNHEPGDEPAHHWPYRYEAAQRVGLDASEGLFVT